MGFCTHMTKIKPNKIKNLKSIIFTFAVCTLLLCSPAFAKARVARKVYRPHMRVAVSNSFLYDVASFIVKPEVYSVRNIGNAYPGGSDILVTMTSNHKRFASRNKSITFFATNEGYNGEGCEYDYYDPAKIPFITLTVMKAISTNDKKNYPHYQKRLAIYQSILDSTLQVWKKNLKHIAILDLTVHTGGILATGTERLVKPPKEVKEAWKNGDLAHLQATIEQANLRGLLVVTDFATDPAITQNVERLAKKHFHMSRYEGGSFSSYLTDNYAKLKKSLEKQKETEKTNANKKTKTRKK